DAPGRAQVTDGLRRAVLDPRGQPADAAHDRVARLGAVQDLPRVREDAGVSAGSLTALVLAGSRAGGDPLAGHAGVSHKALIDIGGLTMIERVVAALAASPSVARIVICIERPELLATLPGLRAPACAKPVETMPAAAGPSASVAAGLARCGTPLL